jgi:hypothetical protein
MHHEALPPVREMATAAPGRARLASVKRPASNSRPGVVRETVADRPYVSMSKC